MQRRGQDVHRGPRPGRIAGPRTPPPAAWLRAREGRRRAPSCLRDRPVLGVARGRVEVDRDILALAAGEAVGARPAGEPVGPATPVQGVVAGAAGERVGPIAPAEQVVAAAAVQRVGAVLGEQDVGAVAPGRAVADAHGHSDRARHLPFAEPVEGEHRRAAAPARRRDGERAARAAAPEAHVPRRHEGRVGRGHAERIVAGSERERDRSLLPTRRARPACRHTHAGAATRRRRGVQQHGEPAGTGVGGDHVRKRVGVEVAGGDVVRAVGREAQRGGERAVALARAARKRRCSPGRSSRGRAPSRR